MRRALFLVFLIAAPVVLAQSASGPDAANLYHSAAQAYIEGETEQAVRDAERALSLDPENEKIQKLLDLLRQQQPPDENEEGEQDENPEGQQDEGDPQDQQGGGETEPPEEQNEAERDGTDQDEGQPEEQGEAEQGRDQDRQPRDEPTPADTGQRRPAEMSAAQAQRLLDAIAADEELLVEQMRRPTRQRRSDRDW
ncbi:MAG: hypothetical protein AAGI52_12650 [Bacteroidota bacterium]